MVEAAKRSRVTSIVRLLGIAILIVTAYFAFDVGKIWVNVWWTGLAGETRRAISVGFLLSLLIAYGVALPVALIGGAVAAVRVVRGRATRSGRPVAARVVLLSITTLLGLGLMEAGAMGFAAWNRLPPAPPKVPPPVPDARSSEEFVLLVIGESSAEGQPFHPWFSIGHVIAREVERANPGRKVRLIMAASGGVPLSRAVFALEVQKERPDLVLLYAGHNEFQARWGWSRVVNYYADDAVERPREGLADYVGDWTPFTKMIRGAIENQRIDLPPSPKEVRAVVERPVCEPETRAGIAALYAFELETIAAWCDRAGAVPIFVVPAGNDVGFDPDRSVLSPNTLAAGREAFTADFLAARALEATDRDKAEAAYRRLIDRQPGFAEAHYRLALGLQKRGQIEKAREHFTLARDLDGLPMRCPSEFQAAYRGVAAKHDRLILVDAPKILQALSPTTLLDDNVFHDGQHPSFLAYLALARDALAQLRDRKLFGLDVAPPPSLDPVEIASAFGMDQKRWAEVCRRAASFWGRLSVPRYDGTDRGNRAARLLEAAEAIEKGIPPEESGVPGLGVRFPAPSGAPSAETPR